jgi:hypothetical protein
MNVWYWMISWCRWIMFMVKQYMGWLPPPLYQTWYSLDGTDVFETEENKEKRQVVEQTPAGEVRMKYDDETHTFLYWTDRTIPTYYLHTVARKYVLVFQVKEKYCTPSIEYIPVKKVEIKGPFIKYKNPVSNQTHIEKKMNRYKFMGKLKEEVLMEKENKKISFLEYKNGLQHPINSYDDASLYKTE